MQISVLPRKKGCGVGINLCHTSTRDKALTAAFTVWLPLIGAKGWRGSRVHCHLAARRSWVPFPPGPANASVLSQTHIYIATATRTRPAWFRFKIYTFELQIKLTKLKDDQTSLTFLTKQSRPCDNSKVKKKKQVRSTNITEMQAFFPLLEWLQ